MLDMGSLKPGPGTRKNEKQKANPPPRRFSGFPVPSPESRLHRAYHQRMPSNGFQLVLPFFTSR